MNPQAYRWVIVAAGGLLGCVAIGAMFSLPVLLSPMATETGWSRTGISSAMTIGFLAMAFGSVGWGAVTDRYGPWTAVMAGSLLLPTSLLLAGRSNSLLQFQLTFGLLVGVAAAAIIAPMMAAVIGWFDTRRSLAVSLVSAGMGVAPMTMSPLVAWLAGQYDWRTTLWILAALVALLMVPVSLLVRSAPRMGEAADGGATGEAELTFGGLLRSPLLIVLLLTYFCCCATHSGPIFHTVSYAMICGIPAMLAVSIYSVEGIAGMGGRIVFGLLGDRFGARNVLVAGLLVQAIGALLFFFVRQLGEFYAVAALFGFTYAGVMPLYAVIARESFPMKFMGRIVGSLSMAGSLGMAAGPLVGGWIYDTWASYGWLYLGSFGIGLGATLLAVMVRSHDPDRRTAMPQPA